MPGKRLRAASWSGLFGAVLAAGLLTGGTAAYASTTWIVDNTNSNCSDSGSGTRTAVLHDRRRREEGRGRATR